MPNLTLAGLSRQAIKKRGRTYERTFPEAASQTFKIGDFVILNSGGQVAIAATAGNSLDSTGSNVIGRAMQVASGTTNTQIRVEVATVETEYMLPTYHATPASAITAYTNNDVAYTLINETTGGWMFDLGTTTNGIILATDIALTYNGQTHAVGDQYAPHWCKIISAGRYDTA